MNFFLVIAVALISRLWGVSRIISIARGLSVQSLTLVALQSHFVANSATRFSARPLDPTLFRILVSRSVDSPPRLSAVFTLPGLLAHARRPGVAKSTIEYSINQLRRYNVVTRGLVVEPLCRGSFVERL